MMKLCINLPGNLHDGDAVRALDEIKAAGFDCTFICYDRNYDNQLLVDHCKAIGLEIDSVHAQFTRTTSRVAKDLNAMWLDEPVGDEYLETLIECTDFCRKNGVSKCVIHNAVGTYPPPVSEAGRARFRKLFEYAERNGVRFAIENLESIPHLEALFEECGDYHGFCWDTGHNVCYTPMCDLMEKYGDRLLVTHINSNIGITRPGYIHWTDDLHLLPFDGSLDCEWAAEKIKTAGFAGPLTFELKTDETDADFYMTAFDRATRFSKLINS